MVRCRAHGLARSPISPEIVNDRQRGRCNADDHTAHPLCPAWVMTEPGAAAHQLMSLPQAIPRICEVVHGLIIHYRTGALYKVKLPRKRLEEARTRHIARVLARICELDDQPLTVPRPPRRRFIGCCRDFATLFCAILLLDYVQPRVRSEFPTYSERALRFA